MLWGERRDQVRQALVDGEIQDPDTFAGRQAYERQSIFYQVREAVEEAMASQDITQAQLARAMGVSEGRVSQIFAGDQNLTIKTLAALSAGLGIHFRIQLVKDSPLLAKGTEVNVLEHEPFQQPAPQIKYAGH